MADAPTPVIRCPECGHRVPSFFHHIGIDCEHDMTEEQIRKLEGDASDPC